MWRVAERWRFHMGATAARELELNLDAAELSDISAFWTSVPSKLMDENRWKTVHSRQISSSQPIHVKEGWAVEWVLKHLCRSQKNFGKKHLSLCDNLGVVPALSKGRAQSDSMNR